MDEIAGDDGAIAILGVDRPLTEFPEFSDSPYASRNHPSRFPHAIRDTIQSWGVTVWERAMLELINQISDKPDWNSKVFDEAVVSKWHSEAMGLKDESGQSLYSEKAFKECICELRAKAKLFEEKGFIAVLDCEATIVKSDVAVPASVKEALLVEAGKFESVPEGQKDWHPGSHRKVLDLVHPSLFALEYGKTRVLRNGEKVPLHRCVEYTGSGKITSKVPEDQTWVEKRSTSSIIYKVKAFDDFAWLPSDVQFVEEGKGRPQARIMSYVNNVHPLHRSRLYAVLERLVDCTIPLWEECLSFYHDRIRVKVTRSNLEDFEFPRRPKSYRHPELGLRSPGDSMSEDEWCSDPEDIVNGGVKKKKRKERWLKSAGMYTFSNKDDEIEGEDSAQSETESSDEEEQDPDDVWEHVTAKDDWEAENGTLKRREPTSYVPYWEMKGARGFHKIDLRQRFASRGIQVIFKLANIHLTPETPTYDGGTWHIEGSLHEHICASAIYYYDSKNVTESRLAFRQVLDEWEMTIRADQGEFRAAEGMYDVTNGGRPVQDLGSVMTPEDRLLVFPNVLRHKVLPFELADKSKPGHRKILAMFLVDPFVRVVSTANVPPQRADWWAEVVRQVGPFSNLPQEVFELIMALVDDPMTLKEAEDRRERLMESRQSMVSIIDDKEIADVSSTLLLLENSTLTRLNEVAYYFILRALSFARLMEVMYCVLKGNILHSKGPGRHRGAIRRRAGGVQYRRYLPCLTEAVHSRVGSLRDD